jgi:release factor glutamine methyltransferase
VARLRAAGCVFAEDEAAVLVASASSSAELADLLRRRVDGIPLEHVVGWVDFAGRRIVVDEGVFVPRRRSELLVREAVAHLTRSTDGRPAPPAGRGRAMVADLCCGCGAIGVAIATAVPGIDLVAADLDEAAARCAARNVAAVGGTVVQGDLFAALPVRLRGRVDVLVANAPYVPTDAIALMPPEARDHEPAAALDGGPDGTDILRRVIAGAPEWLTPGGLVLVEVGRTQLGTVVRELERHGLMPRIVVDDDLGGIVATGRRPAPRPIRWQS